MSEDKLQAELFKWFWNNYPKYRLCLFHVPNEGKKNMKEAMKLKAIGVIAGIPDLILAFDRKVFFIELKKDDHSYLSKSQKDLHLVYKKANNRVFVIKDLEKGKKLLSIIVRVWGE